jgi:hypothetical protein
MFGVEQERQARLTLHPLNTAANEVCSCIVFDLSGQTVMHLHRRVLSLSGIIYELSLSDVVPITSVS